MNTHIFYSGSKGNSTFVSDGETSFLIDAGGTLKSIRENLAKVGSSLESLSAIFITHEHTDHTKALFTILKRQDIRIYTTLGTARAICSPNSPADMDICSRIAKNIMTVKTDKTYEIGSFSVNTISTSHDSAEPCGFVFESTKDKKTLGYVTDTGYVTPSMTKAFEGVKNIILESNHDVEMLKSGPYPEYLKMRILSAKGHLSNADASSFMRELARCGSESFVLAHLSEENNTPTLALDSAKSALSDFGGVQISVAGAYRSVEMEIR